MRRCFMPGDEQEEHHRQQFVFAKLVALSLRLHQRADHAGLRIGPAPLEFGAQIAGDFFDRRHQLEHQGGGVGGGEGIHPAHEFAAILKRKTEHFADDHQRQLTREALDDIGILLALHRIDEVIGEPRNLRLERLHAVAVEHRVDQFAQAPMRRIVQREHVLGERPQAARQPPKPQRGCFSRVARIGGEEIVRLQERGDIGMARDHSHAADHGQLRLHARARLDQTRKRWERIALIGLAGNVEGIHDGLPALPRLRPAEPRGKRNRSARRRFGASRRVR